ncbi:MAG: trypsin-like peptidase domain-containing protein [Bacillota bacterium]|nr:trypsin-like peptidase domain-containing protein [Bacillota bacterium]
MRDGRAIFRHLRRFLVAMTLVGFVSFAVPQGRPLAGAGASSRTQGRAPAAAQPAGGRLVDLGTPPAPERSTPAPGEVGVEADYVQAGQAGRRTGTGTVVAAPLPDRPRRILVVSAAHVLGPPGATWLGVAVHLPGSPEALPARKVFLADGVDLAVLEVPSLDPNQVTPFPLPAVAPAGAGGGTGSSDPSGAPAAATAGEVDCVRGPAWSFQSFPVAFRGGGTSATGFEGATVATEAPAALPGCSGGALLALPQAGGLLEGRWLGLLTSVGGSAGAATLSYIPAQEVARAVAAYDRISSQGGRGGGSPPR